MHVDQNKNKTRSAEAKQKNAHSLAAKISLEIARASSLVSEFVSWLEEEEEERMPL